MTFCCACCSTVSALSSACCAVKRACIFSRFASCAASSLFSSDSMLLPEALVEASEDEDCVLSSEDAEEKELPKLPPCAGCCDPPKEKSLLFPPAPLPKPLLPPKPTRKRRAVMGPTGHSRALKP